ncbi:uncharacterized protein LOC106079425 isoform X2 [Biomphalaria glabrata]|nr:uncharacterized protein LOC106079425 isoform X2 [Biomphalaria glabrata]
MNPSASSASVPKRNDRGPHTSPIIWPQLVGKKFEEASEAIKSNNPSISIQCVTKDTILTMDYRLDRVRIYVDDEGIVARAPKMG